MGKILCPWFNMKDGVLVFQGYLSYKTVMKTQMPSEHTLELEEK